MLPKYIGEHQDSRKIKYLSEYERQKAKIKLDNGLFYDGDNQLINTINPQEQGRYATSSLYVVDTEFNFYVVTFM